MAGMRLPIAPMGVQRRPGGGLVPGEPQDPLPLIKLVLDLKHRQEDQAREQAEASAKLAREREQELAKDFPVAAREAREFQLGGWPEAAEKRIAPHGLKLPELPGTPEVPGYPGPVPRVPGSAEAEYHRNRARYGFGEGQRASQQWLEGQRRRQAEEDRRAAAQKRAADREKDRILEKMDVEVRDLEKEANKKPDAGARKYSDYAAYNRILLKEVGDRLKAWKEGPVGKQELAKTRAIFEQYRSDVLPGQAHPQVKPGETELQALDRLYEERVDQERDRIAGEVSKTLKSPDDYMASQAPITIGAPPEASAPAAKAPDMTGATFTPKPEARAALDALRKLARDGNLKARGVLQARGESW